MADTATIDTETTDAPELEVVRDADPDEEGERKQLSLFEGTPVHARKAALGSAGDLDISDDMRLGQRVSGRFDGHVAIVKHHDKKGTVTRQHTIVVDRIEFDDV